MPMDRSRGRIARRSAPGGDALKRTDHAECFRVDPRPGAPCRGWISGTAPRRNYGRESHRRSGRSRRIVKSNSGRISRATAADCSARSRTIGMRLRNVDDVVEERQAALHRRGDGIACQMTVQSATRVRWPMSCAASSSRRDSTSLTRARSTGSVAIISVVLTGRLGSLIALRVTQRSG